MAPRLKVFATRIGFNDVIVAVSSQKAALEAWDVRANLFAKGLAAETQDTGAIAAALKTPGEPLLRPTGTKKPYEPIRAGKASKASNVVVLKTPARAKRSKR